MSWGGFDLINHSHKRFIGDIGVYGKRGANFAIQNCDLLVSIGSRLDTRQTGGNLKTFARDAKKVMVDIDFNELYKGRGLNINLPIQSDAGLFIESFLKDIKTVLPSFDDNVYQQTMNPKFFGKETGSANKLGMMDYVNYLSSQQEKLLHHENKMRYLNTQVPMGDTVDNKGLFKEGFSFKDLFLQDDMSRSEFFLTRKKKFLERYPEGAYTMITLTPYGNEPVELFKKNADDKEWNFRLPEADRADYSVPTAALLDRRPPLSRSRAGQTRVQSVTTPR